MVVIEVRVVVLASAMVILAVGLLPLSFVAISFSEYERLYVPFPRAVVGVMVVDPIAVQAFVARTVAPL